MQGKAFVAILGKAYIQNEKNLQLCSKIEKLQIPMYAIVISGTDWDKFKDFPWRKVYQVDNIEELQVVMKYIKDDIDLYYISGGR